MIKAAIFKLHQRAGGWCEPVKDQIFPLLELTAMSRRFVPSIVPLSGWMHYIRQFGWQRGFLSSHV